MIIDTPYAEENLALSPDDRFVAYETVESGQREVVVQSFPDGAGKWQISQDGGAAPFWGPAGDRLYFRSLSNRWLHVVDVSRDPIRFSAPRRLFQVSRHTALNTLPDGGIVGLQISTGEQQGGYEIWLNWAEQVMESR